MSVRDHGGNLDWAIRHYGGSGWIDLSTGINRVPYPIGQISAEAWTCLPTRSAMAGLIAAARVAYGTDAPMVALSGAQGAIQMIPRLGVSGLARVVGPTYNEHAACLRAAGWRVEEVQALEGLAGADLAVVVNPNNPDGRIWRPDALLAVLPTVGRLVVDESFADPMPGVSLASQAGTQGLLVLRSFGKFYGLAGLRLGFAIGASEDVSALTEMAGPWPVAGAALEIGVRALQDRDWAEETTERLLGEAERLDLVAAKIGWHVVGGTPLFRLYDTPDAAAAQEFLARNQIWSRIFPYSSRWIRLGLPAGTEWDRVLSLRQS